MKIHKERVDYDRLMSIVLSYKSPKLEEFKNDLKENHRRSKNISDSNKRTRT